jgi:hypothetical protein
MRELEQLSKILAKAENNPNEHEAEMAMDRAIALSQRFGIDLAVARAHQVGKERETPIEKRIKVGDPLRQNSSHLMELFVTIASANDLRCSISGETIKGEMFERKAKRQYDDWWDESDDLNRETEWVSGYKYRKSIYAHAVGFPSDIAVSERIYAIAVTQMIAQASKAIKRKEHGDTNAKTWRRNFYYGFTQRMRTRLLRAKQEAEQDAGATEGTSTALVLADKRGEVDAAFEKANPHLVRDDGKPVRGHTWQGAQVTDQDLRLDALRAGRDAAEKVNLNEHDDLGSAERTALEG